MVNSKLVLGGRSRTIEKEFKNLLIGHSKEKKLSLVCLNMEIKCIFFNCPRIVKKLKSN